MSIRNMRIGLRAGLSFAVLAGLLVVVGLFGLVQMATLRQSATVIEESWMPSIERIAALRVSTTARSIGSSPGARLARERAPS